MKNFEFVQNMLSEELAIVPEKITMESRLVEDLNVDSIVMMVIAGNIQDEYGIDIPEEAIKSVKTVKDIVDYLDANA